MKRYFLLLILLFVCGCNAVKDTSASPETESSEVEQRGGVIVQAVIAGNYPEFAAAAGEKGGDVDSAHFAASRKELMDNYGEFSSFRSFGTLKTPLFANIFYAVKFLRKTSDGRKVEHEQLIQLIFGKKDNSWQLIAMRFI